MKQNNKPVQVLLTLLLGAFLLSPLYGQSVADLARQERARKGQERKAGKVFTNEDIRAATIGGEAPAASAPAEQAAATTATGKAPEAGEAKPGPTDATAQAALEKEYREKFAKLREQVTYEEKKLDVLQRELNLMQMQYYSDPNVALRELNTRGEINQRIQEIEAQKGTIEKAKQAVADLEEELRRKNLPPGWAR